ncbi:MAG: CHAD domain-containing protein [Xanthobacteraceae bacterium]|nr:CHAD domain-containing protein [Xanthobacteraceae bacterium]
MAEKPALRTKLAVGEALRAVAQDICATARSAVENPDNTDAVAVHEFRKEMKRWRALLWLLSALLEDEAERFRVEARDLARRLSHARDAQAALDALDDLARHGPPLSPRSIATVRARVQALSQIQETTTLTAPMRGELLAALDRATTAIGQWPLHVLTFEDVARRLALNYRAIRRAIPDDWPQADPEELHDLRKLIISQRYLMEIVEPLWPRFAKMWVGENQTLRDHLGSYQDLDVLKRLTGPRQPLARWRSRLVPAIAHRQAAHVATARRFAKRLYVEKPRSFRRRLEVMWETG